MERRSIQTGHIRITQGAVVNSHVIHIALVKGGLAGIGTQIEPVHLQRKRGANRKIIRGERHGLAIDITLKHSRRKREYNMLPLVEGQRIIQHAVHPTGGKLGRAAAAVQFNIPAIELGYNARIDVSIGTRPQPHGYRHLGSALQTGAFSNRYVAIGTTE